MTERPIIWRAQQVQAYQAGRKSQHRVPLKRAKHNGWHIYGNAGRLVGWSNGGGGMVPGLSQTNVRPGDRLWVRETWQHYDWSEDGDPQIKYQADGALLWPTPPEDAYDALSDRWAELSGPENYDRDQRAGDRRWRPSIHMPKWAARIWLTVTEVRVQRLQDISEEDARAEGVYHAPATDADREWYRQYCADMNREPTATMMGAWCVPGVPTNWPGESGDQKFPRPEEAFRCLWDTIHGAGAWDSNPWVAAITSMPCGSL